MRCTGPLLILLSCLAPRCIGLLRLLQLLLRLASICFAARACSASAAAPAAVPVAVAARPQPVKMPATSAVRANPTILIRES